MLNTIEKGKLENIAISAEMIKELNCKYADSGIFKYFQLRPKGEKKL